MTNEKNHSPANGYTMVFLFVVLFLGGIALLIVTKPGVFLIPTLLAIPMIPGFVLVNPNTSIVLLLFGKYAGTIKQNGLFWVNPLYKKRTISLRASNFGAR